MSVLKMIVVDDQNYVSGEPHGSYAMWVYAACSRNPQNLAELDKLLPEFGADRNLRELFSGSGSLSFTPVDAGLIIVDLAKKWIFAEDTYFGAHRSGWYTTRDDKSEISYRFSDDWQFVAEAKWFRYLQSLDLKPYGDLKGPVYQKKDYAGFSLDDLEDDEDFFDDEFEDSDFEDDDGAEAEAFEYEKADDDDTFVPSNAAFFNRITGMGDFAAQNAEEERDYQTLMHIIRYEEEADTAQRRMENAQKEIASLNIEMQAVENLRQRLGQPRWEMKRIVLHAHIDKHEKHISRWRDEHTEAAEMAAELRNFLVTEKGRERLKLWEVQDKEGCEDTEMPY